MKGGRGILCVMADPFLRGPVRPLALTQALRGFTTVCLVLGGCSSSIAAQRDQMVTLEGTVRDATEGVLVGARIAASSGQQIGGTRVTNTDERGHYRLVALTPGTYEVIISADGFRTVRFRGVELLPGLERTLPARLEPAGIAEEVMVSAADVAIDVHDSAASTTIGRQFLETLPFDPRRSNYGYAVGVLLYRLVSGTYPVMGDDLGELGEAPQVHPA